MSGSLGNMWLNWEVKTPNRTEPYELVIEATVNKPGKGDIAIDDVVFDKYCVYYDGPYTTPQPPSTSSTTSVKPDTSTSRSSTSTTVEQTESDTDGDDTTTIIIVVVVGCVLFILIIGIVFFTLKKRSGSMFGYRNMPGFMTSGLTNPNYQGGDGEVRSQNNYLKISIIQICISGSNERDDIKKYSISHGNTKSSFLCVE